MEDKVLRFMLFVGAVILIVQTMHTCTIVNLVDHKTDIIIDKVEEQK